MWILNQRIHHGAVGAALLAGGLVGAALMYHDRADLSMWFKRAPLGF